MFGKSASQWTARMVCLRVPGLFVFQSQTSVCERQQSLLLANRVKTPALAPVSSSCLYLHASHSSFLQQVFKRENEVFKTITSWMSGQLSSRSRLESPRSCPEKLSPLVAMMSNSGASSDQHHRLQCHFEQVHGKCQRLLLC